MINADKFTYSCWEESKEVGQKIMDKINKKSKICTIIKLWHRADISDVHPLTTSFVRPSRCRFFSFCCFSNPWLMDLLSEVFIQGVAGD